MTQHQLTLDSDGLALVAILDVPADSGCSRSSASSGPLQKILCHGNMHSGGVEVG